MGLLDRGQRAMCLLPGQLVGLGDDRAERHPGARHIRPAGQPGLLGHPVHLLPGFRQRLAPQPEDVAERAADPVGLALDPPMDTGMVPLTGRNPATKFSNR
jgi:hypothetical protein